ncbi:MAG: zinc carboxypeptidase [Bacteroidetes bacterium]|nr:zinc carboxypeptidase [Bacteroidota bacterium]
MKRWFSVLMVSLTINFPSGSQDLKSPGEFLGYEPGMQFTYQHKAVEYFRYIADNSPLAEFREYGTTYEGRTLGVCFVSSEENLANLEELRKNNLIKTGLASGEPTGKQIPFVWLGYNVHGNEAVGMEAAMKTLYTLVSGSYPNVNEYLKSCVIIIDPCQNPDGHELYTSRYRNSMSMLLNPDKNAWEHNQGWPSSRSNHYMFDLNRDWTWQTQTETRQRLALYNQFMPQVHADFHEMGPESTFFFAPAAQPWHTVITQWQNDFHKLMGKGNAELFDDKYRLYFTKESFDLFYPSYGDTWPLFNGAMGFTFEQAGGGVSGLSFKLESGDTLTLKERIDGHFTASMATIKVSYENREKLISEFNKYFEDNSKKPGFQYKSIIIKASNEKSNIRNLLELFDNHQIRYSFAGSTGKKTKGFDYSKNKDGEVTIEKGDILISAYQPQSRFVQVLFEPDSKASDSITYDLSAWALPYVYNLKAYALEEKISPDTGNVKYPEIKNVVSSTKPYAYIADYNGFDELKFMAALYMKDIKVRYSMKPFRINGSSFNRGSIIVARGDNKNSGEGFDEIIRKAADESGVRIVPAETGLVESGKDFGSAYSPLQKKRKIAMLCGEGTSSSAGELWYFFERELKYPVSLINTKDALQTDLSVYDLLILTSGSYTGIKDTITDYVRRGGRVLAMENAISVFNNSKLTSLGKAIETKATEDKAAEKKIKSDDTVHLRKFEYAIESRYSVSARSAGSIYKVKIDDTHPYAFGLGNEWFIMKRTAGYPYLPSGNNIGYILEKEPYSGFAGFKYKDKIKNTLVIGSENIGKGEVIYITDNPYFRAFWKSGRVLVGNVVLR